MSPVLDQATKYLNPFFYTNGISHATTLGTLFTAPTLGTGGYYSSKDGAIFSVETPAALLQDVDNIRLNAAAAVLILDKKIDEILAKVNLKVC